MINLGKASRWALVVAAAAATVALAAPSASAAGSLSASVECSVGARSASCFAHPSGGQAPYTFRWNVGGVVNADGISFGCGRGNRVDVRVVVTDATGATATSDELINCGGIAL